jgi:uncharacterized protein (DUF305 family)
MNMNKQQVLIGIMILLIGAGGGFLLGKCAHSKDIDRYSEKKSDMYGSHQMPDGSVMMNHESSPTMTDVMHDMNASLIGKTGDVFDKAFLEEMIVHHEGAVAMAELALQHANHAEIKDLSLKIIEAQNAEIADMNNWLRMWYETQ